MGPFLMDIGPMYQVYKLFKFVFFAEIVFSYKPKI